MNNLWGSKPSAASRARTSVDRYQKSRAIAIQSYIDSIQNALLKTIDQLAAEGKTNVEILIDNNGLHTCDEMKGQCRNWSLLISAYTPHALSGEEQQQLIASLVKFMPSPQNGFVMKAKRWESEDAAVLASRDGSLFCIDWSAEPQAPVNPAEKEKVASAASPVSSSAPALSPSPVLPPEEKQNPSEAAESEKKQQ